MHQPRRATGFVDDYLSYLLARAGAVMQRSFEREVRAAGLRPLEWRVLSTLQDHGGLTVGELARVVLAKQPTLTKLIDRMVADALVVRRRDDPTDRRLTRVFPTARGRRIVAPLLVRAKRCERAALAGSAPRDVSALKAILRAIISRDDDGAAGAAPNVSRRGSR